MTSLNSEHYLDAVQHLPRKVQRNLSQIRNLDNRVEKLLKKIDRRSNLYMCNIQRLSPEKKTAHFTRMQNLFDKAKEYADRKVQLANDSYDLVEEKIRRLDLDLEKIEMERAEQQLQPPKKGKKKNENRAGHSSDDDSGVSRCRGKKKKDSKGLAGKASSSSAQEREEISYFPPGSGMFDMPVDPNEPTYCLCNQVSYGEMIGCDNRECPIEWFHFPCVGLTTKPMGEWYCPKCTAERKCKATKKWYYPKCAA